MAEEGPPSLTFVEGTVGQGVAVLKLHTLKVNPKNKHGTLFWMIVG